MHWITVVELLLLVVVIAYTIRCWRAKRPLRAFAAIWLGTYLFWRVLNPDSGNQEGWFLFDPWNPVFSLPDPIMAWWMWVLVFLTIASVVKFHRLTKVVSAILLILALLGIQLGEVGHSESKPGSLGRITETCLTLDEDLLNKTNTFLGYERQVQEAGDNASDRTRSLRGEALDVMNAARTDWGNKHSTTSADGKCVPQGDKPVAAFTVTPTGSGNEVKIDATASKGDGRTFEFDMNDPDDPDRFKPVTDVSYYTYKAPVTDEVIVGEVIDYVGRESLATTVEDITVPVPTAEPATVVTCTDTWFMQPQDHTNYRWFAEGIPSIAAATSNDAAWDAAMEWTQKVKLDKATLAGAIKFLLGDTVQLDTLVTPDGVCASALGAEYASRVEQAILDAPEVTPDDVPQDTVNSGIQDDEPVQGNQRGTTGDKAGIRITRPDGVYVYILARSGNPVTRDGGLLPGGNTDNPAVLGKAPAPTPSPTAAPATAQSAPQPARRPTVPAPAGTPTPAPARTVTVPAPTPTGGLDHNEGLLNPPTGTPPDQDPPQEATTTPAPLPTDCTVQEGSGPDPSVCPTD